MKKHILKFAQINKDTFEAIRDGRKRVETRAATIKYKDIVAGDVLEMSCDGDKFEKKIKKVRHFPSISELLKVYKPEDINPTLHSEEALTKKYHSFPNYEEKIKEFGLVAFELE